MRFPFVMQTPSESWRWSPREEAGRQGHLFSHLSSLWHLYAREIPLSATSQHRGHLNVQDVSDMVTECKQESLVGRLYHFQIRRLSSAFLCWLFTQPLAISDTRCVGVTPHPRPPHATQSNPPADSPGNRSLCPPMPSSSDNIHLNIASDPVGPGICPSRWPPPQIQV